MADECADTLLIGLRRALAALDIRAAVPDVRMRRQADLSSERLEAIITELTKSPAINAARPPGITKGRIAALLQAEERQFAEMLMRRLDAAGVLGEPRSDALRWREPRLFRDADPAWILARVMAQTTEE